MAASAGPASASLIMDTSPRYRYRKSVDRAVRVFMLLSLAVSITLLVIIIGYVMYRGASYINWEFLTAMPRPLGQEGGGIANAIVGSLIIVSLATALAVPIAVGAAVFLTEFSSTLLGRPVRFVADVLTGVPSIVVGIFAYTMLVAPFGSFSGLAGAGALAFIMIPIVLIGAQESLRLVPNSLREGALALGLARWRTIFRVVLPAARRALLTALVLAVARVLGETAPLIITSLGNRFWTTDPSNAMAAIPLVIYRYATGPYEQWHQQAWAGAFILLCVVLLSSVLTRFVLRSRYDR